MGTDADVVLRLRNQVAKPKMETAKRTGSAGWEAKGKSLDAPTRLDVDASISMKKQVKG